MLIQILLSLASAKIKNLYKKQMIQSMTSLFTFIAYDAERISITSFSIKKKILKSRFHYQCVG
jgi:hypothetical protein